MSVDRSSVGRSDLTFIYINFDFLDDIFSGGGKGGSYSIAGMYNNAS